jgi:hypothetical protein
VKQRAINLNPAAYRMEAVKITYPANHSRRRYWMIEAMRFIPHDGLSRAAFVLDISPPKYVNNGAPNGR